MQTDAMRERMFTMRLSEEEGARLDALATHYGLNGVGVIRMLLKDKERELGLLFGLRVSPEELAKLAHVPSAVMKARLKTMSPAEAISVPLVAPNKPAKKAAKR